MVMHKVRIAVVFVLVLGLIAVGAGVLTRDPHAAQPQPPPIQKADGGQKLRDLLNKRLEAARKEFTDAKEGFLAGKIAPPYVFDSAQRLLEAELGASQGRAGRIASYDAHLSRVRELDKVLQRKYDIGTIGAGMAAMAEYYRLDAEIRLEQEKAK